MERQAIQHIEEYLLAIGFICEVVNPQKKTYDYGVYFLKPPYEEDGFRYGEVWLSPLAYMSQAHGQLADLRQVYCQMDEPTREIVFSAELRLTGHNRNLRQAILSMVPVVERSTAL